MSKLISNTIIFFIRIYQLGISPLLGVNCRYTPTCSSYSIEAIKLHGPIKGFYLALRRIFSCHPWGGHGYDPVPKSTSNEES